MKINSLISKYIKNNDIKEYNLRDIDRIISFYLKKDLNKYLLDKSALEFKENDINSINELLDEYYKKYIPLQYIIGKQSFYNEIYNVNSSVLVPRQDTEILVGEAIKYINNENLKRCLDLCSGSGCIGISIAKNSNIRQVVLVDISKDALDVARTNVKVNKADRKCELVQSNLFENLNVNQKFDIIVSNPPYIKTNDLITLEEYVKNEPILALNGGVSGLDFYLKIFEEANKYLNDNSVILLEIGYNQKDDLINIIKKYEYFEYIKTIRDYGKNDRVVVCRFHQK